MSGDRCIVHPPALQAGKAATKALIRAAGGQEACEAMTGRSQSRFSDYGGPNTSGFMPVELVRALEAVTHGQPGHPHVTRWLANEAGYVLVRKPRPSARAEAADLHAELAAVSKETHDVVQKLLEALRDRKMTPAEAAGVRAEIVEAQEQLANLDQLLAQIESEGGR